MASSAVSTNLHPPEPQISNIFTSFLSMSTQEKVAIIAISILSGIAVGLILVYAFGVEVLVAVGISSLVSIAIFYLNENGRREQEAYRRGHLLTNTVSSLSEVGGNGENNRDGIPVSQNLVSPAASSVSSVVDLQTEHPTGQAIAGRSEGLGTENQIIQSAISSAASSASSFADLQTERPTGQATATRSEGLGTENQFSEMQSYIEPPLVSRSNVSESDSEESESATATQNGSFFGKVKSFFSNLYQTLEDLNELDRYED